VRCGDRLNTSFLTSLFLNATVKEFIETVLHCLSKKGHFVITHMLAIFSDCGRCWKVGVPSPPLSSPPLSPLSPLSSPPLSPSLPFLALPSP